MDSDRAIDLSKSDKLKSVESRMNNGKSSHVGVLSNRDNLEWIQSKTDENDPVQARLLRDMNEAR